MAVPANETLAMERDKRILLSGGGEESRNMLLDTFSSEDMDVSIDSVQGVDDTLEALVSNLHSLCIIRSKSDSLDTTLSITSGAREAGFKVPIIVLMDLDWGDHERALVEAGAMAAIPWDGSQSAMLRNIVRLALSMRQAEEKLRQSNDRLIQDLVTAQDLRERAEALNIQYIEAAESYALAKQELERSNQDLQSFAYAVSHDLREPLRMVSSYLKLLEKRYQGQLDETASEFIDFAVEGAQRMARMIGDLVEFSRVDTKAKEFEVVSLDEIVAEATDNLSIAVEESGAQISVADNLPNVTGDRSQLVRVLQNLIGNAIKYINEDRSPEIEVGTLQKNGTPVVFVRDNGIGIAEEYYERIFEVFQRLHGRTEYEGTGVGLAVVKRIVERHGGRIWVESEPNQGSTFFLSLRAMN